MKIGEVAKQIGLSEDTLRFYEKENLMGEVARINGIRDYSEANIRRIQFVKCLRDAEVSIEAIREYIRLYDQGEQTIPARLGLLKEQRKILEERLNKAKLAYDKITHKIKLHEKGVN